MIRASLLCLMLLGTLQIVSAADRELAPMPKSVVNIDAILASHWKTVNIQPAGVADELTLYRRLMLDLAGRIPTLAEFQAYESNRNTNKYTSLATILISGPEFDGYFATVLDEMIQGRYAGNEAFVGYLRQSLKDRKSWDRLFREIMTGPWDSDAMKPATTFLDKRAKDIDVLTVDVSRSFFGVDISCARCHDHPLVKDWKREHYYGMAAFLVRTNSNKGKVSEKNDGEAKFAGKDGKEKIAPMMFLTGQVVTGKSPRRETLVQTALDERKFLARAFVNRMWEYFSGQGLVNPVDQIHSGNPASVPALIDTLAEDFAANGYDIRRLITQIVTSQTYRMSNFSTTATKPGHFAVMRLRPLSPRQYARSLILALGDGTLDVSTLSKTAEALVPAFDPVSPNFESSTRETLYVSNAKPIMELITKGDNTLAKRLNTISQDDDLIITAIQTVYARQPSKAEMNQLSTWLKKQPDRAKACEDLVWALVSSAEFRFNH